MTSKTVVTCALTGSFDTVSKNPAVPVTPQQIAEEALAAWRAGAAVVHIHVRDPETAAPSMEMALYESVVTRIREAGSDVVLNLTTGAGGRLVLGEADPLDYGPGTTLATPEARVAHVERLKPEICTLDVGSLNFGEQLFVNIPRHLRVMAERARAVGTKPEIEVFDLGHIEFARRLIDEGYVAEPPLFQLCLGIPYGAPATGETMMAMRDRLPKNAVWSAFGISRHEFPMVAQTVILGGHVRVGLEDNLYVARGELAPGNAALVEKAVGLVETLGGEVASPDEARAIFRLGRS